MIECPYFNVFDLAFDGHSLLDVESSILRIPSRHNALIACESATPDTYIDANDNGSVRNPNHTGSSATGALSNGTYLLW